MKMIITIHGVSEDFKDELKRDIENACTYYDDGGNGPSPDLEITTEDDDDDHKIEECVMCHCRYYAYNLSEDGMCDDCKYEL